MKNLVIICVLMLYIGGINGRPGTGSDGSWEPPRPRCRGGQIYTLCGSRCTRTCDDPNPICQDFCTPRCECPHGLIWHNSRCIFLESCPVPCPPTQEWHIVGSRCNATCEDPTPTCVKVGVSRCECPDGQVFNANGLCIELDECFTGLEQLPCDPVMNSKGEAIVCVPGSGACPDGTVCMYFFDPAATDAVCCVLL